MTQFKSALAAFSLTLATIAPAAAEQAHCAPASSELCASCHAYLVFPPSNVDASASRTDQVTAALRGRPDSSVVEQTASLPSSPAQ